MTGTRAAWPGTIAAGLVLYAVLAQPNHPDALTPASLLQLPLEWFAIVGLLLVLPVRRPVTDLTRAVLTLVLTLVSLLKFADLASFTAFNRAFNPLMDLHLAEADRSAGHWPSSLLCWCVFFLSELQGSCGGAPGGSTG